MPPDTLSRRRWCGFGQTVRRDDDEPEAAGRGAAVGTLLTKLTYSSSSSHQAPARKQALRRS
jgi:hypothetical protein